MIKQLQTMSEVDFVEYIYSMKMDDLYKLKKELDDIYYNTGETSLSDDRYDMIKEIIGTVDVGAIPKDKKVKLPFWLGSMDKLKPEDTARFGRWLNDNTATSFILESKLDGISCLFYQNKLYTRGNGLVGSDISHLIKYFIDSSSESLPKNVGVRGELIIQKSVFDKKYKSEFANPRNFVAGRVNSKTERDGLKDIEFVTYEYITDISKPQLAPSEQLKKLSNLGFKTVHNKVVNTLTLDVLKEELLKFREVSPYEIDGLIIQANSSFMRNKTSNPDYAFAFKMRIQENEKLSTVVQVEWNPSKWGMLKPRVKIQPIELGGVTITWATGFNAYFIDTYKIGPGAVVKITRSGDVIPHIISVEKPSPSGASLPADVSWTWSETGIDIVLDTVGSESCIKLMNNFFSKMGIKFVSTATIQKIYDSGFDTLLKILHMTKDELIGIGLGEKTATRVYDNIHNGLKEVNLY